ncbi:MAG: tRNA 2-thiocytidine(32) synthetase TtcA [Desulfuromonadales bacterium]|nr:tRNA 2-thiocytidine(32) synthetase TtcA [Desulfuromonadales bacterium]
MRELPLFRKLRHSVGKAVADFGLIQEGDRIAVAVSGGKDSYTMLLLLDELRRRAPVRFEITALTIDSGYQGFRSDVIEAFIKTLGIPGHLERTNHYDIISEKRRPGSSYCSICARLKRGALYGLAESLGCNKLALGHHSDDFIETLLLNQFFVGSLKAMSANMLADNGKTTVIRPLVYVAEEEIIRFSQRAALPVVCCRCPVCGSADLQRKRMKNLLTKLEKDIPHIKNSMLKALSNVHPRHLLDQRLRMLNQTGTPADTPV